MKTKFILFGLLLFTGIVTAQIGDIRGKIIDSKTKQPLVGTNVIVLNETYSEKIYGAATDGNGYFLIKDVPENIYKIKVSYLGYKEHIEPDIRVIRNKTFDAREIELIESVVIGDEIVVNSGYFDEHVDAPVSNYTFTKDEIIRAPGAGGSVFRAIDNLPGVSSSGGEFSAFSVRGNRPKDNIILVDNIPFGRLSHFNEVSGTSEVEGGRLSIFTNGLIEKATFQGGGFSAKQGGKFASFLDLTLKEGNKESYKFDGTYDLFGWEANYDGKTFLLDNSSLRLSARAYDFKNAMKLIDEVGWGFSKLSDYVGKFTTDINSSHKLSILGIYSTEAWTRTIDNIYDSEYFENRSLQDDSESKYLGGINWRFLTDKNSYLTTSAYFNQIDTDHNKGKANVESVNGIRPDRNEAYVRFPLNRYNSIKNTGGIKSDFVYSYKNGYTFSSGINIQRTDYDSEISMNGKDTLYVFNENELSNGDNKFLVIDPNEIANSYKKKRMEYAGYSEISIPAHDRLKVNVGLRYEYNSLTKDSDFSPRLNATYRLCPQGSLNFAAGIYYQIPDMMLLSGHRNNIKVKNEKAYHYIFGLTRYFGDDIKFTAETYYKHMEDLVVRPYSNSSIAENSGKGYAYGFDISLLKKFVTKLYGQANYSYGVSKIKERAGTNYYNSTFNQPHIFNFMVGYQLNDNWSFTAKWKYATGRPKDDYKIFEDVHNDPQKLRYAMVSTTKNSKRYEPYHTLNVRVDYRVQLSNYFAMTAFLDLMNLYDNKANFAEYFHETTGRIEGNGSEFLPRFGFKFEF